jgi:uncharacterized protein (DUF1015 family)
MATLRPFQGIMYDPQRVDLARVVAPPYDVISPRDQQRYYAQDAHNVVRLIAGEVRPNDSAEDNKYLRAARFFEAWLAEGILRREPEPSLYVYRHAFVDPSTGEQRMRQGILGVVELEPFGRGVLPHEQTHARAKADRLSLTRAVSANLSPIFALYEDPSAAIGSIVAPFTAATPRLAIDGEDGDHHSIWSITDHQAFQAIARVLAASRLYIADGHHRYETALNFRNKMRLEHPEAPPDAAFNYVLTLLVDVRDPGLAILPTHRIVHDLLRFDASALIRSVRGRYAVTDQTSAGSLVDSLHQPSTDHRVGMAVDHRWLTVDIPQSAPTDPVSALDVSVLHREILQPELGLGDELLEEERHVSYSRDAETVLEQVETGSAQAGFLLRPPLVRDVVAVARAGQVMPQKSTYFYPKPASGIVFNPLDPTIQIPAV